MATDSATARLLAILRGVGQIALVVHAIRELGPDDAAAALAPQLATAAQAVIELGGRVWPDDRFRPLDADQG